MNNKACFGMILALFLVMTLILVSSIQLARTDPTTITVSDDYSTIRKTTNTADTEDPKQLPPNPPDVDSTILILVNDDIHLDIKTNLTIFEQDLKNEGYEVLERTITGETSPPEIKDIIKHCYLQYDLIGTILIGNVKAAYCEIHTGDFSDPKALKIWISLDAADMYYMDLDGYWEHVPNPDFCEDAPPNVVECYTYPSCKTFKDEYIVYFDEEKEWDYSAIEDKEQYQAEIWVSRIMAHNLNIPGKDEVQIINDFLYRDHLFRTGEISVSDKAYLLNAIDECFQNMDYSGIFNTVVKREYATKNDYLACLEDAHGSKLMYLLAHSNPQLHALYDTSVSTSEILNKNKTSVFYILNACSAVRWDHYVSSVIDPNYLGGLYVFDTSPDRKNYGLGAIGFTGVGGFNWLEYFTDYLNDHAYSNYGEAYKYWFNKNLMHIFGPNNYAYLGDPTIGPKTPIKLVDHTIVANGQDFHVLIESNSTVSNFQFIKEDTKILFNVTGPAGKAGFCKVTIPNDLLWGEFEVFKNGAPLVEDVDYTQTHNGTHYIFYINYIHSTHTIEIIGTEAIPEFPSQIIMSLFMLATLLAVIVYRRKYPSTI